jgi:hypothetical protein
MSAKIALLILGLVLATQANGEPGDITQAENPLSIQTRTQSGDTEVVTNENLGATETYLQGTSTLYADSNKFLKFETPEKLNSFVARFGTQPEPAETAARNGGECPIILGEKFCIGDRFKFGSLNATLVQVLPSSLSSQGRNLTSLNEHNLLVLREDNGRLLLTTAGDLLPLKKFLETGVLPSVWTQVRAEHNLLGFVKDSPSKAAAEAAVIKKASKVCEAAGLSLDQNSVVFTRRGYISYLEAHFEQYAAETKASCLPPVGLTGSTGQSPGENSSQAQAIR